MRYLKNAGFISTAILWMFFLSSASVIGQTGESIEDLEARIKQLQEEKKLMEEGQRQAAPSVPVQPAGSQPTQAQPRVTPVSVTTQAVLGSDIKTYRVEGQISEFTSSSKPVSMMGNEFRQGVTATGRGGSAYYNLNSQYTNMSGVYGPTDSAGAGSTATLTIFGDGNSLASFEMRSGNAPIPFNVKITGVAILRIEYSVKGNGPFVVTDAVFSSEPVNAYPSTLITTDEQPTIHVLGRDIKAYRAEGILSEFTSTLNKPISMTGIEFRQGVVTKQLSATDFGGTGSIYYNLNNQYMSMSGLYGPTDGAGNVGTATLTIFGDDNTLTSFEMRPGDPPIPFNLNVAGVTQLRIEYKVSNSWRSFDYLGPYAVVDMALSQETFVSTPGGGSAGLPQYLSTPGGGGAGLTRITTVPAGTPIRVTAASRISTETAKAGDGFRMTLAADITDGDRVIASRGANVIGVISESDPEGKTKGVATMSLTLTGLTFPDGRQAPIRTNVHSVDAAGGVVTEVKNITGTIFGPKSKAKNTIDKALTMPAVIERGKDITFNLAAPLPVAVK